MVKREAKPENLLGRGAGPQLILQALDLFEVNDLLVNDQPIQFDHGDFSWHGVETLLDHGIFEKFDQERFVFRSDLPDGRIVRGTGLP